MKLIARITSLIKETNGMKQNEIFSELRTNVTVVHFGAIFKTPAWLTPEGAAAYDKYNQHYFTDDCLLVIGRHEDYYASHHYAGKAAALVNAGCLNEHTIYKHINGTGAGGNFNNGSEAKDPTSVIGRAILLNTNEAERALEHAYITFRTECYEDHKAALEAVYMCDDARLISLVSYEDVEDYYLVNITVAVKNDGRKDSETFEIFKEQFTRHCNESDVELHRCLDTLALGFEPAELSSGISEDLREYLRAGLDKRIEEKKRSTK